MKQQDLSEATVRVVERAKVAFLKVLSAQRLVRVREEDVLERQQIERKASEFFQAGLSSKWAYGAMKGPRSGTTLTVATSSRKPLIWRNYGPRLVALDLLRCVGVHLFHDLP